MKSIRFIFKGIGSLTFLIAFIIIFFFRQEAYQLYKVLTFFDKTVISQNFKGIRDIFPTNTVQKADVPFQFVFAKNQISLPESMQFQDSVIDIQGFLDRTLTDALLIVQHDTIIYEKYTNGFREEDVHISWSMSKSVISALFGIAIKEGFIKSVDETVTDYLPDFERTGYDGVRIKDVLQMSSGVAFNEDYGDFNSDINVLGRYFALGMPMADFAKTLKNGRPPGTYNRYVSVDTQVLAMILTKATGQTITKYMYDKLWSKIGAESDAYWIVDKAGMEFALGGLNVSARDYAKLGQLYLDSGKWQGQQIVPKEWVVASITPDAPHLMPGLRDNAKFKDGYGYQWWIPYGAEDEFNAQGIYGQYIYIDPDQDIVIVRLASNYHFKTDKDKRYHDIEIELFRSIIDKISNEVK